MPRQSWEIGCVYKTPFRKFSHNLGLYICSLYCNFSSDIEINSYNIMLASYSVYHGVACFQGY